MIYRYQLLAGTFPGVFVRDGWRLVVASAPPAVALDEVWMQWHYMSKIVERDWPECALVEDPRYRVAPDGSIRCIAAVPVAAVVAARLGAMPARFDYTYLLAEAIR